MKNLYKNCDSYLKVRYLAAHHPKVRIRKKNRNRLKKNYIRYNLPKMYKIIFGKDIPKKKLRSILIEAMRTKLINFIPYNMNLSNSLVTPLDTMMEYCRLRAQSKNPVIRLKLNERLPDYELTKQRIIKERNTLNE